MASFCIALKLKMVSTFLKSCKNKTKRRGGDYVWPAKDKILILWPFTERDGRPLLFIILSRGRPSEMLRRGMHNKQRIGNTGSMGLGFA